MLSTNIKLNTIITKKQALISFMLSTDRISKWDVLGVGTVRLGEHRQ
jgi:hypothetical protein